MTCPPGRIVLVVSVCFVAGCGGSPKTPTAPTATISVTATPPNTPPTTAPPVPSTLTLSGTVTSTVTGRRLADLPVSIAGFEPTRTDANGAFRFTLPNRPTTYRISVSGNSVVARDVYVSVSGTGAVAFNVIELADGFDQKYYEQLVRNGFEGTGREPIRRWTQNPKIYLKTVDDRGRTVGAGTLAAIETIFSESAQIATSGRLRVASFERGTGDRLGQSGWITVRFTSASNLSYCGRAQIAVDGGWIEFNLGGLQNGYTCRVCPSDSETDLDTIRHEFGHALGFYHTNDRIGIMNTEWNSCRTPFSAKEILHGSVAYARPLYNTAPDADPSDSAYTASRVKGESLPTSDGVIACGPGHK